MPAMNLPESRSVSSTSCNSIQSDLDETLENGLEDLNISKSNSRPSSTSLSRKAKRIRFYRNGDKFFTGVVIPVMAERFRSFDSLTADLTRLLVDNVTLPSGVRTIYSMDGRKITNLDDLEDGKSYVCSGKGETFKKIPYTKTEVTRTKRKKVVQSASPQPRVVLPPDCVRPRIVTLIRNGIKPRKVVRLLLNKRNSSSMDQVLSSLTDAARLDSGAVRKVFTISGQSVISLPQFFENEDVFFVYGNERFSQDDFELEFEESKSIQQFKKTPGLRNGTGPKPKMPGKSLNKALSAEENSLLAKLSKDNNIILPNGLKHKYTVGRMIGDGNFAVVRLCKDKQTNDDYALKIIDKSKCKGKEDMVENEVRILRKLTHPNIIKLVDEQDTRPMLYLVVELVKGGDLFDAITVAQKFSEQQAALMITHLTSALAYLHNLNIVHRDVKPENLLVDMHADEIKILKLADFGLACEVNMPLYTVCGTPTYVAPEILAESGYGLKIDVWAAGVILYILLCGFPPFVSHDNDQEKLFDCILSGQYDFPEDYWQGISHSAKDLIQNMLQLAPDLRFSAEDVLDHPWFQMRETANNAELNITI